MTIAQMAQTWTGGGGVANWAATVAGALGVSTSTTLAETMNSAPTFNLGVSFTATPGAAPSAAETEAPGVAPLLPATFGGISTTALLIGLAAVLVTVVLISEL